MKNIGTWIAVGLLGFAAWKYFGSSSGNLSDDQAAQQIIALYRQIQDATAKGDDLTAAQLSTQYQELRAKYPNANVAKYV